MLKWGSAIAAAVGLHAVLFVGLAWQPNNAMGLGSPTGEVHGAQGAQGSGTKAVIVRWAAMPTLAPTTDSPMPPTSLAQSVNQLTNPVPPPSLPESAHLTPAPPTLPLTSQAIPSAQAASASSDGASATQAAALGQSDYLPRSALTHGPQALAPVIVNYPTGITPQKNKLTMVLALYIDENGYVRRIEPQGERLDPAFEHAANDAFLQARFTPGDLHGQPVRSRIDIEVSFDVENKAPGATPNGANRSNMQAAPASGPTPALTH